MTPEQFVVWGRRIADAHAQAASRLNAYQRAYEFDSDSAAAEEFLSKANEVARAFTIPGGQNQLALVPALRQIDGHGSLLAPESEAMFNRVYEALRPVLSEILNNMWVGDWDFNDSGLAGTLKIEREKAAGNGPFYVRYVDSQGTSHETVVTRSDDEYGMSYESLHIEVKYGSTNPVWKIHAFLFRWDRRKMAGIVDHGETEGRHSFYAIKKAVGGLPLRDVPPPLPPWPPAR